LLSLSADHLGKILRRQGAATRQLKAHVWLIWALVLRPGVITDIFAVQTCGRFTRNAGPQHAGGKPTRLRLKPDITGVRHLGSSH
jgi:hypothetical protein